MHKYLTTVAFLWIGLNAICQPAKSNSVNNLVLPASYTPTEYGAIPPYKVRGHGKNVMLLIPGLGFDGSVFDDFVTANEDWLKMYIITIPGFGNTTAAPMDPADTSYGNQYWTKGVIQGILQLLKKEKMTAVNVAGHFALGGQLALRLALEHPKEFNKVILLGSPAKFIVVDKSGPHEYPLRSLVRYIDKNTAPGFFGKMDKAFFDQGNYRPEVYSLDSSKGKSLWNQVTAVPLPVMIRYILEFETSDIAEKMEKIQVPVLVMRPTFDTVTLDFALNNYLRPQFIDSWAKMAQLNKLIRISDIPHAATFVWKDNPGFVYDAIRKFIETN